MTVETLHFCDSKRCAEQYPKYPQTTGWEAKEEFVECVREWANLTDEQWHRAYMYFRLSDHLDSESCLCVEVVKDDDGNMTDFDIRYL